MLIYLVHRLNTLFDGVDSTGTNEELFTTFDEAVGFITAQKDFSSVRYLIIEKNVGRPGTPIQRWSVNSEGLGIKI